jgi:hypothetical protein
MSMDARLEIVESPLNVLTSSQRCDLLDPAKTNSELIALIQYLNAGGFTIGFTAINSDHHYDGPTEHSAGLAFDGWPKNLATGGGWLDDIAPYLAHLGKFPRLRNVGLAGSAYTPGNLKALGLLWTPYPENPPFPVAFHDNGGDHIHHNVLHA